MNTTATFFLYARKSTDVEDKQVLSIDAQLNELREFARREKLAISAEFIEKQSAKIPGRPIFNQVMDRLEAGEAIGIVAWHPDRLSRNGVDSGRITFALDAGKLSHLKFPSFWFENTPQGKFMLNMAFSQSKYYVDALSDNTKRGLREKVRRGEYPSRAPLGYLHDGRSKTIILDPELAPIIKEIFERYASGKETLDTIRTFLAGKRILTKNNKKLLGRARISYLLSNPFYYGLFRYSGEVHEGKHPAVISKALFDRVQEILTSRSKRKEVKIKSPKAFTGLLRCVECGGSITAEVQKGHTYYRCTKKNRISVWCSQPYVREEVLDQELSSLIAKYVVGPDWAGEMLAMLEAERKQHAQSTGALIAERRAELEKLTQKLQRLTDAFLDAVIDRETYAAEKEKILSQKKSLAEQRDNLSQGQIYWLEPFEKWIKTAQITGEIAQGASLIEKKNLAQEIFGSNLFLDSKKARGSALKQWSLLLEPASCLNLVRERGLEPPPLAGPDPKSGVSAISPLARLTGSHLRTTSNARFKYRKEGGTCKHPIGPRRSWTQMAHSGAS
jgi:site-specific DNA recombinase